MVEVEGSITPPLHPEQRMTLTFTGTVAEAQELAAFLWVTYTDRLKSGAGDTSPASWHTLYWGLVDTAGQPTNY